MDFDALVKKLGPKIKAIAIRLDGKYTSFNDEDLYQQALLGLWQKYNAQELEDKNESYIVQGCSFDMRNHIRMCFKGVDRKSSSIYESINERGDALLDVLPGDNRFLQDDVCDYNMHLEKIRANLSKRERQVLKMSMSGATTREIGCQIGVSHVMVVKIKKKICEKVNKIKK